jgi:hypothetical protein
MKGWTTHLVHKPEHAVDLDTGGVVAASIHPELGEGRKRRKVSRSRTEV